MAWPNSLGSLPEMYLFKTWYLGLYSCYKIWIIERWIMSITIKLPYFYDMTYNFYRK